jgi:hypothetical protein
MSTRDFSWGVKAAGAWGWRPTTLVVPHPCSAERQKVRGLNLPGTPLGYLGLLCTWPLPILMFVPANSVWYIRPKNASLWRSIQSMTFSCSSFFQPFPLPHVPNSPLNTLLIWRALYYLMFEMYMGFLKSHVWIFGLWYLCLKFQCISLHFRQLFWY